MHDGSTTIARQVVVQRKRIHAIDPENILTNALSNDFVHIQENVVEYYEAVEKDNKIK